MDKSKFYTVEKEINGTKYVAQFSGLSVAVRGVDGTTTTSTEKLGQYILDNVIVEPKGLTADSFDTMEEYNAVTTWGRDVMYGKFRKESNANGAKAKG